MQEDGDRSLGDKDDLVLDMQIMTISIIYIYIYNKHYNIYLLNIKDI
jgi:hypothetical protein